jgi:hypothetical protein
MNFSLDSLKFNTTTAAVLMTLVCALAVFAAMGAVSPWAPVAIPVLIVLVLALLSSSIGLTADAVNKAKNL